MTRVVHCKKEPFQVYIGRPSKWGNPYQIGKDGTRGEVLEKYQSWILDQPDLLKAIVPELKDKTLGCWCHPKGCHGDILARMAENIILDPDQKTTLFLDCYFVNPPATGCGSDGNQR